MSPIEKSLAKLSPKEREFVLDLLRCIYVNDIKYLNVLKLKGPDQMFRVRKGKWRIIYERRGDENIILRFTDRNEKTYRDL